jgi:hypothetical protein
VFFSYCFLFVLLLQVFNFYFHSYFLFFFLYYQLYHHHLLILTVTSFILTPSLVLKSIALLPNYSSCTFSSTLSPCLHFSLPFAPKQSPDYLNLLHTQHLVTSTLYQLYTTPTPSSHWHKLPTLQQQKYTQTYTKAKKFNSNACTPLPSSPFSATLTNSQNFYS